MFRYFPLAIQSWLADGRLFYQAADRLFMASRYLHFAKIFTWPQVAFSAKIFPHIVNAAIPFAHIDQPEISYNRLNSAVYGWHGSGSSWIAWVPERTSMRD